MLVLHTKVLRLNHNTKHNYVYNHAVIHRLCVPSKVAESNKQFHSRHCETNTFALKYNLDVPFLPFQDAPFLQLDLSHLLSSIYNVFTLQKCVIVLIHLASILLEWWLCIAVMRLHRCPSGFFVSIYAVMRHQRLDLKY